MGAESSAARSCRLEEPSFTLPAGLSVYRAVLEEEQPVSVFIYQRGNEEAVNKAAKVVEAPGEEGDAALREGDVWHLKTLRHPCLLRFLSSTVEVDGIHLVTERVQPLHMILEDLSADEICAGIFDVLQALIFLHDRGKLSHNNVCISSVFVSEDGHWKLGGMESMCQFSQASAEFLSSINSLRDLSSIAPEEQSAGFQILPEAHGHARDAYSFGVMVEKLLPLLGDVEHLLTSFQEALKVSLLNPDPMQRPSLQSLLTHEFFSRNEFLEVVNFLKSLTLKTEEEKNEFFKFLLDRIQGLPESLMASRLVPQLLTPLVFAEPVAIKSFLPHLLRPKKDSPSDDEFNSLLSPNVFRDHVIPILLKLYSVREEHVRMVLLSHLDTYADLFQLEDLQEIVLPQVLLGLRDTSNSLVSGTLCSLAVLVPLLGADVVVGGERAKIFKRTTPNFRSTEITPEGSPAHVNNSHELHSSLALNNNSFKLFSKISEPKKKPTCGKEKGHTNLTQIQHSSRFQILGKAAQYEAPTSIMSMNGIRGNDISGAGSTQNSVLIHEFAEDWPDWSKSEENERNVGIKIEHTKDCISTGNQSEMKDESWDDFEPTIDDHPCTIKPEQSNKQQTSDLPITGNKAQSKGMKLSLALKTRSVTSCENWRNDNWNQQNISKKESQKAVSTGQTFSRQKTTAQKTSLNTGLGEEFTINVKKKPQRDPELDLFADMIPDIKVSSTGLLMPTQRTELNVTAKATEEASKYTEKTLRADGNSPTLALASKFAADIVEVETEGWEDDLNWEDNSW
ncbi:protein-associating with the carboxyl-terminal domain of ezrin isoform X3 [Hemiscyllium ocellatum]|uniref:protein-associating with the carboxyl-terminal domain of ezrin isoform X3 n=1 Tax=Hemiscyllium ocellatum TaxID=170820 RepID=UPI00296696CD|nr:protein-associating with the carboxyl-terminal domain of ezrin isoform X3 [Hemiscyllium ocellatum]